MATAAPSAGDAVAIDQTPEQARLVDDLLVEGHGVQSGAGDLRVSLAEQWPDDFANSGTADDGVMFIHFRAAPPAAALEEIERSGLHVRIVEDLGYSITSQQLRVDALADGLEAAGITNGVVQADPQTGRLEVLVPAELMDVARELADGLGITDFTVREGYGVFASNRGGLDATFAPPPYVPQHVCTWGWSVERLSDGQPGIATAGHCPDALFVEDRSAGERYAANLRRQHEGGHGDMQWHTTPGEPSLASFYADLGTRREVRFVQSASSLSFGDRACVFGMTTLERHCGRVFDRSATVGALRGLATTSRLTVAGGDSGGGVSYATTALGLITGYIYDPTDSTAVYTFDAQGEVNGCEGCRIFFTKADRLDEGLNVKVMSTHGVRNEAA